MRRIIREVAAVTDDPAVELDVVKGIEDRGNAGKEVASPDVYVAPAAVVLQVHVSQPVAELSQAVVRVPPDELRVRHVDAQLEIRRRVQDLPNLALSMHQPVRVKVIDDRRALVSADLAPAPQPTRRSG